MRDASKALHEPARLTVPVPDFGSIVQANRAKAPVVLILAAIAAMVAIAFLVVGAIS